MCTDCALKTQDSQRGISLIEVLVFIVVVSVGVTGLMSVLNSSLKYTADPMRRKQALAVAEALLEEVQTKPFTDCDPEGYDSVATPPTCVQAEAMGPEVAYASQLADESRPSLVTPFDNVNDYNGFNLLSGGTDIGGVVIAPAGYTATVTVAQDASFGLAGSFLPGADVLRITVTVSYDNDTIVMEGYRTRYAPNDMP